MQSWLEGRIWVGKGAQATGMTASLRIQSRLGELHKEWTEVGVSASRVTTLRRLQEKGYQAISEPETTSEFSGAWGKRGEGGQGREGVQLPDSPMDEAVLQSAGPRLETTQSPPWWQQAEEAMWRVGGITCTAEGFAGETGAVDVLEGGERDTNDLLSCSHYPLKGLAAGRVAGAIPHSDAASQDALDGASVEGAHDGGRGSGSSEF